MKLVARAELELDKPIAEVFAKLIDYAGWPSWMPAGFQPVSGPQRALQAGDRIVVKIAPGLPGPLRILRVRSNEEISWRGGIPGVLVGVHSFFLEELSQARTRVRSEEPFSGVLTWLGPLSRTIGDSASTVSQQMLEGLRDALS
jgi:hypothetical protein